tara:strand:- start:5840 stop:6820 length:981 start_codon:yes stop_codon:yes gene_type:complete
MKIKQKNDLVKLGDALPAPIDEMLNDIKTRARKRSEELGSPEPVFGDWSRLSHDNLELNDWIERGEPTLTACDVPTCGRCQNGFFITRLPGALADTATMCKYCEHPRRFIHRLNKMRLPADAVDMHFGAYQCDSSEQFEALNHFRRWIQGDPEIIKPPSLFMFGTPGNGKSSALYCLAREAAYHDRYHNSDNRRRRRARYIAHSDMLQSIRRTFNDKYARDPLKNWLNGVNLLLVDELGGIGGSANKSSWWIDTTVKMIEEIWRLYKSGELAIVFTSNLSPAGIHRACDYNEAVKSRLTGMFKHSTVQMLGRDRRVGSGDLGFWDF